MTSYTINLPWDKLPLSMNDRRHWRAHYKAAKDVKDTVTWLCRAQHLPAMSRVRVDLHYRPARRRQRDADNAAATYKPCADGVVAAGVVRDDHDGLMERGWPTIHPVEDGQPGSMWLVVTDLSDEPREAS